MNSYSPAKTTTATTRTLSLPSLLRDEQLFGTRERDPFVPRLDTHYFAPKSCYVLVEDSTGEHRPVVTKEYERPRRGEDPAWPVLWGGIEGRGGFYRYEGPAIKYERRLPPPVLARPVLAAIQPTGFAGVAARAVGGAGAADLRRTVSLSNLRKNQPVRQGALPEPLASKPAYIAASGNSQTITSNIASSTRSGALVPGGLSGMPDKRLAILERSMVSMGKGGLSKRLVPGKLRRSTSVDAGLNVKAPAPRSEPKKPGYCENCRIKYDDFKEVRPILSSLI
jgi:regulatory subunit for Cdc7p protein kinase